LLREGKKKGERQKGTENEKRGVKGYEGRRGLTYEMAFCPLASGTLSYKTMVKLVSSTSRFHVGRKASHPGALNQLSQYASSSGNRAYWYAELAASSLA